MNLGHDRDLALAGGCSPGYEKAATPSGAAVSLFTWAAITRAGQRQAAKGGEKMDRAGGLIA